MTLLLKNMDINSRTFMERTSNTVDTHKYSYPFYHCLKTLNNILNDTCTRVLSIQERFKFKFKKKMYEI